MKNFIIWLVIIVAVVFGGWYLWKHHSSTVVATNTKTVMFTCDAGKTISATFDQSTDGTVSLVLSDGRTMTLPHVVSADGGRYANADESIVFWNVGTTAFMTEGLGVATTTYANCVEAGTAQPASVAGGTITNSGVVSTYTNPHYGFSITYSQDLMATSTFDHFYNLNSWWRANASPDVNNHTTGTAVVMIPIFSVNRGGVATGQPYPLYFAAETRVGVSSNATDVAQCTAMDPGYTQEPEQDVTMGGITWKKYTFADQAMMQYVDGVSYRTVHNGACYVVEAIKVGSVYKDNTMTAGIPQATLDSYFTEAQNIAESFMFTK